MISVKIKLQRVLQQAGENNISRFQNHIVLVILNPIMMNHV